MLRKHCKSAHRQTHRHGQTHMDTQTDTHRHVHGQTHGQTCTQTDTHRHTRSAPQGDGSLKGRDESLRVSSPSAKFCSGGTLLQKKPCIRNAKYPGQLCLQCISEQVGGRTRPLRSCGIVVRVVAVFSCTLAVWITHSASSMQ